MATPAACEIVGLIADTHGVLDDSVLPLLRRASHTVLHAGDVGDIRKKSRLGTHDLLRFLQEGTSREVHVVRGNVDVPCPAGAHLPTHLMIPACGAQVLLTHISGFPPKQDATAAQLVKDNNPDVVVFGHSHIPGTVYHDGVLYINPGSAGPQRFSLPRCLALLHLAPCGGKRVEFLRIGKNNKKVGCLPGDRSIPCPQKVDVCSFCSKQGPANANGEDPILNDVETAADVSLPLKLPDLEGMSSNIINPRVQKRPRSARTGYELVTNPTSHCRHCSH